MARRHLRAPALAELLCRRDDLLCLASPFRAYISQHSARTGKDARHSLTAGQRAGGRSDGVAQLPGSRAR